MGYCECAEKSESGDDAVLYEAMGATILQATPREETHSSIKDISGLLRTIVKLLATSKIWIKFEIKVQNQMRINFNSYSKQTTFK